jgi:hypothetical protein
LFNSKDSNQEIDGFQQADTDIVQKIKNKRSFREIFHKRETKQKSQPARKPDTKRSSVAGSALAQRIRNSTNFSKAHLPQIPDAKTEAEQDLVTSLDHNGTLEKESSRQATLLTLKLDPPQHHSNAPPASHCDTATIVNNIIDRVTTMSAESPDRLRGLEIAEVCHFLQCRP